MTAYGSSRTQRPLVALPPEVQPELLRRATRVPGVKHVFIASGLRYDLLTEQPEPALIGNVEIWCGLTPEWTPERVRARRDAGEEVWWYICCGPKAPYVTEFIDHPGTELRLWPWQSWQYGEAQSRALRCRGIDMRVLLPAYPEVIARASDITSISKILTPIVIVRLLKRSAR